MSMSNTQIPNVTNDALLSFTGDSLTAHVDGACSGNPGPGGWSVVFSVAGKDIVAEYSGGVPDTTNNRMELMAIREAIRLAPSPVSIEITTDSANAIGWLSKGWRRNEATVARLCQEIDALTAQRSGTVSFRSVKGHSGDMLNERADRLATAAVALGRMEKPVAGARDHSTPVRSAPAVPLLTLREASALARVHANTLTRWCAAGTGPELTRLGSRVMITRAAFDAWIERRTATATGQETTV